MKKLIQGIVEFRRNVQEGYREAFGRLATGQSPDTLFIACSDSRVVPNTFASTDPGDLFVLRNVGNLVPPCGQDGVSSSDESEAAAIEYSVESLSVQNIVVCGHSECAAMKALIDNRNKVKYPNLKSWLRHGDEAVQQLAAGIALDPTLAKHNQLSQLNVLLQMEHVKSYPAVKKRLEEGTLGVHGWWFDIAKADVYALDEGWKRFTLIDEEAAERIIRRLVP
ncbi:MAG: carbonic anhydrase [Candidatus Lambdaproteobacteria bacterium RIFOXYD1_FULL_56_27]|uniref:carbonic anhydrase n=1 Tax=Candidatus Lambdaproteobacteria bacterium RIFOXYD2_FULL_56_26 TaxID=1817773 RepID=A0A1F6GYV8_9PROT|nr:MAG: carbonic anhydrase [Candidatus Lambdaproteobacteria bacterium RIFOXYC1_FULL_56_13]OGH03338.1 MAG: carbonic anhydrase [Candidatus Lambdaproteobacteria bacterium RIFOXYD2_FULL_56_26]OGH06657.1 MAG: carbonic anhydrase [Candidatus Lambdaproteobacteria bacterium RIFOXYD1_FULL_56_27]